MFRYLDHLKPILQTIGHLETYHLEPIWRLRMQNCSSQEYHFYYKNSAFFFFFWALWILPSCVCSLKTIRPLNKSSALISSRNLQILFEFHWPSKFSTGWVLGVNPSIVQGSTVYIFTHLQPNIAVRVTKLFLLRQVRIMLSSWISSAYSFVPIISLLSCFNPFLKSPKM